VKDDPEVPLGCVVAYALWVVSTVLIGVATVVGDARWAWPGILAGALAATATVRGYMAVCRRMVEDAFELGRQSAGPRPVQTPTKK
jgi:hypothetical protein